MKTIRDVMQPDPIQIRTDATIHGALELLIQNQISGLPVIDETALSHVRVPLRKLLDRVGDDHLRLLAAIEEEIVEEVERGTAITILDTDEKVIPVQDDEL